MKFPRRRIAVLMLVFLFFRSGAVFGQEEPQEGTVGSVEGLIELLKEKGVISSEEADDLLERSRQSATREEEQEKASQEALKKEVEAEVAETLKEEAKAEAERVAQAAVPEWTKRISFGGDIRLRYEGNFFDDDNAILLDPADPTEILNTRTGRNRFRFRLRFGMNAQVNEQVLLGLRLTTGNIDNPVSTNQTMGDFFSNDSIALDLAYLRWTPVSEVSAWAGRFPNPWFHTNLVWDPDLNFEGVALKLQGPLGDHFKGFLAGGALPLEEVEFSKKDKWLFGGQGGIEWTLFRGLRATVGVAYYDFTNSVGIVNDPLRPGETDWTAPAYQQKGNTLMDIDPGPGIKTAYASDFNELDVVLKADLSVFEPVHVMFEGDFVKNLGFDQQEVAERTGNPDVKDQTTGFQIGLIVGHPRVRMLGAWKGFFYYRYLEADAVMDAFTESDFALGGTNSKGWIAGGELGLMKNVWLRGRWLSSNEILGPPLAIDVCQIDLNASF